MRPIALALASVALFAADAAAQRMGSSNANAPRIEQVIDLGTTGKVRLNYIAITWGKGQWARALENEETRERVRDRINRAADQAPLGSFECTQDVLVGGVLVPAGDYALSFQLDEEFRWQMVLSSEENTVRIPLALQDNPQPSKRLVCALYAGDEDFTGGIYLAFGGWFGMLSIEPPRKEV